MRKRSRLLACAMIGALVLSGIPNVPSQAVGSAANTVFAGGNGTSGGERRQCQSFEFTLRGAGHAAGGAVRLW